MAASIGDLRHSKEQLYGTLILIFGIAIWLLLALVLVAGALAQNSFAQLIILVVEIAIFALIIFIMGLFHRAYLFGHAVLITERQFPQLHASLQRGAEKLGLASVPQSFLYNSNGLVNAFAARMGARSMVLITSAIVDVDTQAQVDFIIGHELGQHAAGHLSPWKNFLKLPGTFVPLLSTAYHRARELTADRIGAYCVDDLAAARGGLAMLACGSAKLNAGLDLDAFAAQEKMVPPVTGFLLHIFSTYPRLTRRIAEVEAYFRRRGMGEPGVAPSRAFAHA
ncbi:hypothetical protein RHAL1_01465 [Beijerinckiaceae bacterium RH AL1]|nr:M48 family metallopeptidase [Beijerinckiaceae bacterium]VVB44847.1 hypothetical protein RHCH11_RHCH11_01431 [Beijerinckiaceae bacterium RH CH11]VVB44926.1 hypothetical protein RHAL8_01428 [Beijerinckiaceae bacterium RH AL8]VVC54566.1 hypothetical protein RHAL1_01465 [Beijerinckiaceae bacterium RH AL1]